MRGEEGAEVTIDRKASTTTIFAAAGFARWFNVDESNLYDQLLRLASKPNEDELQQILDRLVPPPQAFETAEAI